MTAKGSSTWLRRCIEEGLTIVPLFAVFRSKRRAVRCGDGLVAFGRLTIADSSE
jgi:hypothetical protein